MGEARVAALGGRGAFFYVSLLFSSTGFSEKSLQLRTGWGPYLGRPGAEQSRNTDCLPLTITLRWEQR